VRAVWEEHTGWFRQESTTELYAQPPSSIWAELAEVAGGPDVLAARASARVLAGEAVEALHLTDIALSVDPGNKDALEAQIAALGLLIERNGGRAFDELGWLENELARARQALAG
jgi:hypothetical protein